MHTPNLFTREDTLLGVCEGLGEDFRINPNLIRIAFAIGLFFNPVAALGTYLCFAALVVLTRLLVPAPRMPKVAEPDASLPKAHLPDHDNDRDREHLRAA